MAIVQFNRPNLPNMPAWRPTKRPKNLLLVLLCGLVGFGGGLLGAQANRDGIGTSIAQKQQYVSSESQLIAQIAKNVGQGVVSIDVQGQTTAQDFFGYAFPQQQSGAGTGFIISDQGIIATNRHVVPDGTTSVSVGANPELEQRYQRQRDAGGRHHIYRRPSHRPDARQ